MSVYLRINSTLFIYVTCIHFKLVTCLFTLNMVHFNEQKIDQTLPAPSTIVLSSHRSIF